MLASVSRAQQVKKLPKAKLWAQAAEFYKEDYVANCAVAEEARLMIRAPATADMIKASYEAMAERQRAFVARAGPAVEADMDVAVPASGGEEGAASALPVAADAPEPTTKVSRPSKKRAQWQERINEGRELTLEDVEGASPIGVKALVLYLRAMDVKVTRDVQVDAQALRQLARQSLLLLQGRRWSKVSRTSTE